MARSGWVQTTRSERRQVGVERRGGEFPRVWHGNNPATGVAGLTWGTAVAQMKGKHWTAESQRVVRILMGESRRPAVPHHSTRFRATGIARNTGVVAPKCGLVAIFVETESNLGMNE